MQSFFHTTVMALLVASFTIVTAVDHNLNWGTSVGDQGTTTIAKGDTVIWTWIDSSPHSVNSAAANLNSGVQTSATFSFTFDMAGSFEYFDTQVATSKGVISVTGSNPTMAPTPALPPTVPTAGPTLTMDDSLPPTSCLEWVLGYTDESCSLTCSRVSRQCDAVYLSLINDQAAFEEAVLGMHTLRGQYAPGTTAAEVCNKGINFEFFAPAPALVSYKIYGVNGYETQTYCTFPTSPSNLELDCDAKYTDPHPTQRLCPCTTGDNCMPSSTPTQLPTGSSVAPTLSPTGCFVWILGYSTWSCDQTCAAADVQGVCNEDVLQATYGWENYQTMVEEAYLLGSSFGGVLRPNNTDAFCTYGIQTGPSPNAFAYITWNQGPPPYISEDWVCIYAPDAVTLDTDCSVVYGPPAFFTCEQRFCPCNVPDCTVWQNTHAAARRQLRRIES